MSFLLTCEVKKLWFRPQNSSWRPSSSSPASRSRPTFTPTPAKRTTTRSRGMNKFSPWRRSNSLHQFCQNRCRHLHLLHHRQQQLHPGLSIPISTSMSDPSRCSKGRNFPPDFHKSGCLRRPSLWCLHVAMRKQCRCNFRIRWLLFSIESNLTLQLNYTGVSL